MKSPGRAIVLSAVFFAITSVRAESQKPSGDGVAQSDAQFGRYWTDTIASLECLRGPTGLVADKGVYNPRVADACPIQVIHPATTPTNMAFDILVQAEAGEWSRVRKILRAVAALERMPKRGLFFSLYSTRDDDLEILDNHVSSVDNFHLALALWSLSRLAPDTDIRTVARDLFASMDFTPFYDAATGLIFGRLQVLDTGAWVADTWHYGDLGSESRSIYTAGYALGLFTQADFLARAFASLQLELSADGRLLHVWDGGIFQLYLPDLLLDEKNESPVLSAIFADTANFLKSQTLAEGDHLPGAYSACQLGNEEAIECKGLPCYNGLAGLPALVSSANANFLNPIFRSQWDIAVPAYGVMLAARDAFGHYSEELTQAESLGSSISFYQNGLGFFDSYFTKAPRLGQVVPAILALDQSILALAAYSLSSGPVVQASFSALAMRSDAQVAARLAEAYRSFEAKILSARLSHP